MIDYVATVTASRTLGKVRELQPNHVLCGRLGTHAGNACFTGLVKQLIWNNRASFFKEIDCDPAERGAVDICERGIDIPSNYVILATTFMNSHRGNKLFHKLTFHAFESYGSRFSPSWIAERVFDGVSNHNPPLIFCFPNTTNPRSTSDLVPVGQYATIDLVSFVLRMLYRGRDGYACLQSKLGAIEDLLICQSKYSAGELHKALFLYSLHKNVHIAANEQKKDELDFPKAAEVSTTRPYTHDPENVQMESAGWNLTTRSLGEARSLVSSDDSGKGHNRKRGSVDGRGGRNHDDTRKKKTREGK